MTEESLHRLIYASVASQGVTVEEARSILASSRRNNEKSNITGVLLFSDGRFIQILEGSPAALDGLLDILRRDLRHRNLDVLSRDAIEHRNFPDWSMAYIGEQEHLSAITGLSSLDAVVEKLKGDNQFAASFVAGCQQHLLTA